MDRKRLHQPEEESEEEPPSLIPRDDTKKLRLPSTVPKLDVQPSMETSCMTITRWLQESKRTLKPRQILGETDLAAGVLSSSRNSTPTASVTNSRRTTSVTAAANSAQRPQLRSRFSWPEPSAFIAPVSQFEGTEPSTSTQTSLLRRLTGNSNLAPSPTVTNALPTTIVTSAATSAQTPQLQSGSAQRQLPLPAVNSVSLPSQVQSSQVQQPPLQQGPQGGGAALPVQILSANAVGHLYIGNSNYLAPRHWFAILHTDNEGSFIRKISRRVCRNDLVRYTVTGANRTIGGLPVVPLTDEIKKSIKVLVMIYLTQVFNEPYNHLTDSVQQFTQNWHRAGAAFETLTRVNTDGLTPDSCLLFQIVGEAIKKR